jgi:hypothetical protein
MEADTISGGSSNRSFANANLYRPTLFLSLERNAYLLPVKDLRQYARFLERGVLAIFSTVSTELGPNWASKERCGGSISDRRLDGQPV